MEQFEMPSMYELCLMHVRTDRAMRNMIAKQLDTHGLTMMEWLVIGIVSQAPKEGFSMSQIAQALDVTLPQVTALVNSLTKIGLIKQKVLAVDRRGRQVMITPKGSRLLSRLEQRMAVIMQEWMRKVPSNQLRAYLLTVAQLSSEN
jgi:DNA-binding MarR family transcriptional regulator